MENLTDINLDILKLNFEKKFTFQIINQNPETVK